MCLGLDLCVEEGEEQGVVDDEPSSQPPPRPFAAAFTFLIFFQLMGAVMLGFGIYALATDDQVAELIVDEDSSAYENLSSRTPEISLVCVSAAVVIVAFFGCCGAYKVRT